MIVQELNSKISKDKTEMTPKLKSCKRDKQDSARFEFKNQEKKLERHQNQSLVNKTYTTVQVCQINSAK